ncbi:MAG: cache domain-containing protein, partial [Chloroflexota bacterium]
MARRKGVEIDGPPRPRLRPALRLWLTDGIVGLTLLGIGTAGFLAVQGAEARAIADARARVDKGAVAARQLLDLRQWRLGDQAELLASRPAVVEAFAAGDLPALNEALAAARGQFGAANVTALVVTDETGQAIAEQPPRPLYDYSQLAIVRTALRGNQPAPWRQQRGIEARPTANNPLNDLGLAAAFPIVVDGKPAGAVVLLRVFNDGLMNELAAATGLDVAVVTAGSLIAGSRDVRALFQPPQIRPPGQRLAPVAPIHEIGAQTYVASSQALRSRLPLSSLATPIPTPPGGLPGGERPGRNANARGPANVATL